MVGPGQVEDLAVGVGAKPGEAVGAGQGPLDPHVGDLAHRSGGQTVPHVFTRGNTFFSTRATSQPASASQ